MLSTICAFVLVRACQYSLVFVHTSFHETKIYVHVASARVFWWLHINKSYIAFQKLRALLPSLCILLYYLYYDYYSRSTSHAYFSGRQGPGGKAPERGREKGRAIPGVQSLGLPVGERREKHRLRRLDWVHEEARSEIRGRRVTAVRGSGCERRARGLYRIRCGVEVKIGEFRLVDPCSSIYGRHYITDDIRGGDVAIFRQYRPFPFIPHQCGTYSEISISVLWSVMGKKIVPIKEYYNSLNIIKINLILKNISLNGSLLYIDKYYCILHFQSSIENFSF